MCSCQKKITILVRLCGRHQKENVGPMWNILRKEIDLQDPTLHWFNFLWVALREKQKLIITLFKPKQGYSEDSPLQN